MILPAGLLAAAIGGASVATYVAEGALSPARGPGEERAEPGSVRFGSGAADPARGAPWVVRVSTGRLGLSCLEAGRRDGAMFGSAGNDGRVRELPAGTGSACGDLRADTVQLLVARHAARPGQGARTVVYGRADEAVERLRLTGPGIDREPALGEHGTFILVLDGLAGPTGITAEATLSDGSTHRTQVR